MAFTWSEAWHMVKCMWQCSMARDRQQSVSFIQKQTHDEFFHALLLPLCLQEALELTRMTLKAGITPKTAQHTPTRQ